MTELEQLYFNDKEGLTSKIADALEKEDQSFIKRVNQEFSYEYYFRIDVSGVGYKQGELIVDTPEEAKKYKSGELNIHSVDVCWCNGIDMDPQVSVWGFNTEVYGLSIISPSLEAQERLQKSE